MYMYMNTMYIHMYMNTMYIRVYCKTSLWLVAT